MKKVFLMLIGLILFFGCIQQEKPAYNGLAESLQPTVITTKSLLVNSVNYSYEECYSGKINNDFAGLLPEERKVNAANYCNEKFFGSVIDVNALNCNDKKTSLKATEDGFTVEC